MTNRKVAYIVKDHKPLVLTAHETVQHACLCSGEVRRVCCSDRLNRQHKADIRVRRGHVRF